MEELKPCPFCGGRAVMKTGAVRFHVVTHYVRCEKCGSTQWSGKYKRTKEEAISVWNTRHGDQ